MANRVARYTGLRDFSRVKHLARSSVPRKCCCSTNNERLPPGPVGLISRQLDPIPRIDLTRLMLAEIRVGSSLTDIGSCPAIPVDSEGASPVALIEIPISRDATSALGEGASSASTRVRRTAPRSISTGQRWSSTWSSSSCPTWSSWRDAATCSRHPPSDRARLLRSEAQLPVVRAGSYPTAGTLAQRS